MRYEKKSRLFYKIFRDNIKVLFSLVIVFSVCYFASTYVLRIQHEESKLSGVYIDKYGKQGLPIGVELQDEPDMMDEDYVYYGDRILKKFKYSKESNEYTASVINGLMNSISDTIPKYLILVPTRIKYESKALEYSDNSIYAINEIYEKISKNVVTLDADFILKNHSEEYIYLRTDLDLTSLGSYYISKMFCEEKGITPMDINSYHEYRLEKFSGVYTLLENSNISNEALDYVSYYIKDGCKNWQNVTVRRSEGRYETFESPAISPSRGGMDIFISGGYSHSILQGDMENGKTLLIIGDSSAETLAVWMTPYYENVYLVGTKRYQGGKEGFNQIFKDYNITDVILTEQVDNFGQSVSNGKIKEFTP